MGIAGFAAVSFLLPDIVFLRIIYVEGILCLVEVMTMIDEKGLRKLDDEELEQVAGGCIYL